MTAIVYSAPPWQFFVFPLVIKWQADYDALNFYFPHAKFGLVENHSNRANLLHPPRHKGIEALRRGFSAGELRQYQAYLDYLTAQAEFDEIDLNAAIRGEIESALPQEVDRELLWSLAYQLEMMLSEEAVGLQHLARQQQALEKALGEDLEAEIDLDPLQTAFNPSLHDDLPDPDLARVRYLFWRHILAPHLHAPWAALVLESAAGKSSPRYLWEADAADDVMLWRADFELPDRLSSGGTDARDLKGLQLEVEFQKTLENLLQTLTENPAAIEASRQKMLRLVEQRLWPSVDSQAQAIHLKIFGCLKGAVEAEVISQPMMFLSQAK